MSRNRLKHTAAPLIALILTLLPTPGMGESMTLSDAIETALLNNPDMRIASVSRRSAEIEVSRIKAASYPTISADLGVTEYFDTGNEDERHRTLNAGFTASYNLYSGGADTALLKGAQSDSAAAELDFDQERQVLILDVAISYLEALSSSEVMVVRQEDLLAAQTQLERVKAFYEAGSRPVTDLYQQQASVKEAELSLISAQRDLTVNRLNFLFNLGLEEDPGLEISDPALQHGTDITVSTDLDEMIAYALTNRSDIAAQNKRIKGAEQKVSETKAGNSVTVDLFGGVSTSYSSLGSEGLWDQMSDDNLASSVGINLSLPLYDARQTDYAVQQAELDLVFEQITLNRLKQQIKQELGQALEDYLMAAKNLEVSTARLQWAEKALESVRARYESGAANLVELNDARGEAIQARYDVVSARYDRLGKAFTCAFYQGNVVSAVRNILAGGNES